MGSDKTKGFAGRSVKVPGYHMKPKYDLVHTRHVLNERRHKRKEFVLNLAPMVDMFSILVIYLIMNFSSSGEVFFIGKDIVIPQASKGLPMGNFPLVSVVRDKVMFEAPDEFGKGVYVEEPNDGVNERLRAQLRQIKELEVQIGGEKNFKGQVNIQADQDQDADEVKKVMRVLIEEGWTTINFIVEPRGA